MSWNHRLILKSHYSKVCDDTEYWFDVHEVYYDENGVPDMYTVEPVRMTIYEYSSLEWFRGVFEKLKSQPILIAKEDDTLREATKDEVEKACPEMAKEIYK